MGKKILREFDEEFPYNYTDAREREDYFRRALKADFPYAPQDKIHGSWEAAYYTAMDNAETKKKEAARKQRMEKHQQRQAELNRKSEIASKFDYWHMWSMAVAHAVFGADTDEVAAKLPDGYDDGFGDFPIILKSGERLNFVGDAWLNTDGYKLRVGGSDPTISYYYGMGGEADEKNICVYFTVSDSRDGMFVRIKNLLVTGVKGVDYRETAKILNSMVKERAVKCYDMARGKMNENVAKTVRINESALMDIISSSIREVLKEEVGTNIFGGPVGESDNFRGCPSIKIRFHGEWSDPELLYNGYAANYYEVEDYWYECAKEEGINADDDDAFDEYCQEHEEDIQNHIMEVGEKEDY